jgi:hypothetical protein
VNKELVEAIARQIVNETILANWLFYALVLDLSFLGAVAGAFLTGYFRERGRNYATSADLSRVTEQLRTTTKVTEEVKAELGKATWLSQEIWQRKYTMYCDMILACEQIADALWQIKTDTRIFTKHNAVLASKPSTDGEAVKLLPHDKPLLEVEDKALEKIQAASAGAALLLSSQALAALAELRKQRTQALYLANYSYARRIDTRVDAAVQCKEALLAAAKQDLRL